MLDFFLGLRYAVRYRKTLKEGTKSGPWTEEEEKRLVFGALVYLPGPTTSIAGPDTTTLMTTETDDPDSGPRTEQRRGTGLDVEKNPGSSRMPKYWAQISKLIPGRYVLVIL